MHKWNWKMLSNVTDSGDTIHDDECEVIVSCVMCKKPTMNSDLCPKCRRIVRDQPRPVLTIGEDFPHEFRLSRAGDSPNYGVRHHTNCSRIFADDEFYMLPLTYVNRIRGIRKNPSARHRRQSFID